MNTEILSTHTPELFAEAVQRAAALLRTGAVVALPTETVYGLAANALDEAAVSKIFQIKGRPAHNPLIVHVASRAKAARCVTGFPEVAEKLSRAFCPGPLTLVLPCSDLIPARVTAGGGTVAIRWPAHPFIQAVIRACGFPLAAPSANLSNRFSPTNAGHVRAQLAGKIPLIVDGGQSQVGIESTVLDLSVVPPVILRPGMIHAGSLAAIVSALPVSGGHAPGALRSPGQLPRHYSPKAKLWVWGWPHETALAGRLAEFGLDPATVHILAHTRIPGGETFAGVSVIPHDAEAFARALYAELHRCDDAGVQNIVVEQPPNSPEWAGILDRLRRAAA